MEYTLSGGNYGGWTYFDGEATNGDETVEALKSGKFIIIEGWKYDTEASEGTTEAVFCGMQ